MTVRHRGEDLAYPLLLDPQVAEVWATAYGFQNCGNTVNGTGGVWTTNQWIGDGPHSFIHTCDSPNHQWGYGLYVQQVGGGLYHGNTSGSWSWWAPTDAYIDSVAWSGSRHNPAYNYAGTTLFYAGIYDDDYGWRVRSEWGNASHLSFTQVATVKSEQTRVNFGLHVPTYGTYWGAHSGLEGAYIVINDNFDPANVLLTNIQPALVADSTGDGQQETPG